MPNKRRQCNNKFLLASGMATAPTKTHPRDRKKQTCCYAPGCRSGYTRTAKERRASMFCAPRDKELRKIWERNLRRIDKPLTEQSVVCERHFDPRFIMRDFVHIVNGTEVRIPRDRPMLAPGAVPTLLPDLPGYLSKKLPKPRPTKGRQAVTAPTPTPTGKRTRKIYGDPPIAESPPPESQPEPAATARPTVVHLGNPERTSTPEETPPDDPPSPVDAGPLTIERLKTGLSLPSKEWSLINTLEGLRVVFATSTIRTGEETLEVLHPKCVSFSTIEGPEVVAEAFFDGAACCRAIVTTVEEAEAIVLDAHGTHICRGAMSRLEFAEIKESLAVRSQERMGRNEAGTIFSLECARNVIAQGAICTPCRVLRKLLQNKKSRLKAALLGKRPRRSTKPQDSTQSSQGSPESQDGMRSQDSFESRDDEEPQESVEFQENVDPEETPCSTLTALNGSA